MLQHLILNVKFPTKLEACKEIGKNDPFTQGKKQGTETVCETDQMSGLTEKDFKVAIMSMFTELKENMT